MSGSKEEIALLKAAIEREEKTQAALRTIHERLGLLIRETEEMQGLLSA